MQLAEIVATSDEVGATRSRKAKVAALGTLLARLRGSEHEEIATVVSYATGSLRQRRTGLGWRALQSLPDPAPSATLDALEVHASFERIAALAGPGSQQARADATNALFARATADEQRWLRGLVTGEVRQGALDSLVQEGLAVAGEVTPAAVRRAAMMAGSTIAVATAALTGGEAALAEFVLEVGRPVQPMLASSAPTVGEAVEKLGGEVAIDTKLDGIRIQAHKWGDHVVLATRSLDDITGRLPEVVEIVRQLPATDAVLDGEVLAIGPDGRPRPFQETSSRTAQSTGVTVTPFFFDLLHLDGRDLLDSPGTGRLAALESIVPTDHLVRRLVTADPDEAEAFAQQAVASGQEGVVVKDLSAPYAAGRRGASWIKVKPVHTLDLVVLAVEWGSGRRKGWLSNVHLAARDGDDLVMLGKTFKGMTDEILTWQTERFLGLETSRSDHVVHVRPEQVVEIAFDGIQRSNRYPGGVALRFARVIRYRDDKTAAEADTIETVRALM